MLLLCSVGCCCWFGNWQRNNNNYNEKGKERKKKMNKFFLAINFFLLANFWDFVVFCFLLFGTKNKQGDDDVIGYQKALLFVVLYYYNFLLFCFLPRKKTQKKKVSVPCSLNLFL